MKKPTSRAVAKLPHSIIELGAQLGDRTPWETDKKYDVTILGAGYTGVSTALHLAQLAIERGKPLSIALLDAGKIGSGASGKSGGHVCPDFQTTDEDKIRAAFGSNVNAGEAIRIASGASELVRTLIGQFRISCAPKEGYVLIDGDRQVVIDDERFFAIEPYPYVIGLSDAARGFGVDIYEDTLVTNIRENAVGCMIETERGNILSSHCFAAGGHAMAKTVPHLSELANKAVEIRVSTIITEPLPKEVVADILPYYRGERVAFATDETMNVAYGTLDRHNRLIFGAGSSAVAVDGKPIAKRMHALFPSLAASFQKATGRTLAWNTYVENEPLNFTSTLLPSAGYVSKSVSYVHGLGGHGIALGTLLGKLAASNIMGDIEGDAAMKRDFELFASVRNMWVPAIEPLRTAATAIGLLHKKVSQKVQMLFGNWKGGIAPKDA